MKIALSIAIFFIITISCNNKDIIVFESVETLVGKGVEDIQIFSSGNVYLSVLDSLMILVKEEEPIITIYNSTTHNKLATFGTIGRGPGEFLGPSLLKNSIGNTNVAYIHDYKRNDVGRIHIDTILSDTVIVEQRQLPSYDYYLTFLHYINDKMLVATPNAGGNLVIYNADLDEFKLIPYLPKLDFEIPVTSLSTVYRPAVAINEEKNLIVVAPLYLGEINFYNLDGTLMRSSIFQRRDAYQNELMKGVAFYSEIKQGIIELEVSEDFIYALNANTPVKDLSSFDKPSQILVFDWQGDPIKAYNLDRAITSFTVDHINQKIYGYDPNSVIENLVVFDL